MKKRILSFLFVAIIVISTFCSGSVNVYAAEDKDEKVYKLLGEFKDCLNGYLEAVNSEGKKEAGDIKGSVNLDNLASQLKGKDLKSADKYLTFSYIPDDAKNSAYYVLAQFVDSLTDDINLGTIDVNNTNKSAKNLVNYLKDRTVSGEFTKEHGGYKVELKVTGVFSAFTGSITVTSVKNTRIIYIGIARSTLKGTNKVMTSYVNAMSDVVKDGYKKALISVIQELANVTCLDKYTEKELRKYIDKKLKKLQENEFWKKSLSTIIKSDTIYKKVKSLLGEDILSKMKTGKISTEELFDTLKKLNYYSDEEVRNKITDKALKKLCEVKEKLETAVFNQIYDTNCKNYDEYKEKSKDKSLKKARVTLNIYNETLYIGGDVGSTGYLVANHPNDELEWSSSDPEVVTVENGKLYAKKRGEAYIFVKKDTKKNECHVIVKSPTLNKTKATLKAEKTLKLVMYGSNVKKFASSDENIASVTEKGLVTAKKPGETVISAQCTNGKTYKCTITVTESEKSSQIIPTVTPKPEKMDSVKKGDYITLGKYEQDNIISNGKEPIEWEVLAVEGEKALVISKYVIDVKPYNDEHGDIRWETCTLRKFLNEDFYNKAFTKAEKKMIEQVTIENNDRDYYYSGENVKTDDKIFCLSLDEVIKYYNLNTSDSYNKDLMVSDKLITETTPYILDKLNREYYETTGIYRYTKTDVSWWLRSPGWAGYVTLCVFSSKGETGRDCISYTDIIEGVRPAMWITLK